MFDTLQVKRAIRWMLVVLAVSLLPAAAGAQAAGRIEGVVSDSAGQPLANAQVTVIGTRLGTVTDAGGRFVIRGVPAGTYDLRVVRLGSVARTIAGVTVTADAGSTVPVVLAEAAVDLGGIVVSASRRPEKITDAPATITRIDANAIEESVGNSFGGALKQVKGLDFIQVGITAVAVNARGFNSSFNNRMLMMEDNRIAVLPENGLPVGPFTSIPKVDIEAIEVLVGPGSALYGPDASNGVITLQTKDPRQYPGTTVEVSGGSRSFRDVQFRQAGEFGGRFGYKVTGEYQAADDWENVNFYAPIAAGAPAARELGTDWKTNVARGSGALVYYFPTAGRLEFNAGASKSNGIGQTSVGRNQLVDWQYRHGQLKYSHPNWFAQVYRTQSLSGDTYQLNGFAQNRLRFPTISEDSVKHLSDFPAEGNMTAAELQGTVAPAMLNGVRFTYGGQFRRDRVSSMRQWLVDRKTGEDIETDQRGVYTQVEAPVTSWLRLVAAGRYDKHTNYDAQFSPKAGVLWTPVEDQTWRLTFNRAFKSPTTLQTGFFFPDFAPFVGVFGNANGYVIKKTTGETVRTIAAIEPETNDTWELGYRGVSGGNFFLDITGYLSSFDKFMSPLVVIANPFTPASAGGPTEAFDAVTGEKLTGATGGLQIPLTYFNVGKAVIHGVDAGVRYAASEFVTYSATFSFQKLDHVRRAPGDPIEATAFNSPTSKWTAGMAIKELVTRNLNGNLTLRHVNGYDFRSGVNVGYVPTFSTADIGLGYNLPALGAKVSLNVQNLFACRSGRSETNGWIAATRPAIFRKQATCGFGLKHAEMINMPEIGTMVFLGLRYDR